MIISITIPDSLGQRIKKFREGILKINISEICSKSIKRELDKLDKKAKYISVETL